MADFIPVPCPDEAEAGSLWRSEKLKDFIWRAKCLGIDKDPLVQDMVAKIQQETEEVENIKQKQQQNPDYAPRWWQDGEYDTHRADLANDEGHRLLKLGQISEAFDAFTEAIRLCPTSPIYHCNRSAVALKLQRPDIAADDALNAIERDAAYLKAYTRAAKAYLMLYEPHQALAYYHQALDIVPGGDGDDSCIKEVRNGIIKAEELVAAQQAQRQAEYTAAQSALRPALPRDSHPSEEDAVLLLHTADEMLRANKNLESAKAAKVEALILCGRYSDALIAADGLIEGSAEQVYLKAEALWRRGDVHLAVDLLMGYSVNKTTDNTIPIKKLQDLLWYLEPLSKTYIEAVTALEEDQSSTLCIELCTTVLDIIKPITGTGLATRVYILRAKAQMYKQQWRKALEDLDAALAVTPNNPCCFRLQAEIHQQMGAYTDAFLDLQRLKKASPDEPGLDELLFKAAKLCSTSSRSSGTTTNNKSISPALYGSLKVLGLTEGAKESDIRQAYLKLAAIWHPDKWMTATDGERQHAEAQFKQVHAAYESLCNWNYV